MGRRMSRRVSIEWTCECFMRHEDRFRYLLAFYLLKTISILNSRHHPLYGHFSRGPQHSHHQPNGLISRVYMARVCPHSVDGAFRAVSRGIRTNII